jgi:GTP pyrophosphokinase
MIVAGGRDLRVLVIKLADRLHNMRTLRYQPAHKQQRIARATQEMLVPLADRLGIHVLKRELEGLCFGVLQPEAEATARLDRGGARTGPGSPPRSRPSWPELRAARIGARDRAAATLYPRTGPAGSAAGRRRTVDAARVLVLVPDGIGGLLRRLGARARALAPGAGPVPDHIAVPKFNPTSHAHDRARPGRPRRTCSSGPSRHWLAEHGVAAHLQAADRRRSGAGGRDMEWLRRLLAWPRSPDAAEFIRTLRDDPAAARCSCSPPAAAVPLPAGSPRSTWRTRWAARSVTARSAPG